jgi:hypothetical protein
MTMPDGPPAAIGAPGTTGGSVIPRRGDGPMGLIDVNKASRHAR